MAKKIYPNDLCPCGSGKKYKNCCGKNTILKAVNFEKSDLQMEDFVLKRLDEDLMFLAATLQIVLGPEGYNLCSNHKAEFNEEYITDKMMGLAEKDVLEIYPYIDEQIDAHNLPIEISCPYAGGAPKEQNDILSLDQNGFICGNGRQVELFHAYLMSNLNKRFNEYFYLPEKQWTGDPFKYGASARRGYDFLFAMTIYLEMQLGVHVYMDNSNMGNWSREDEKDVIEFFDLQDSKIPKGMFFFLRDYKEILTKISTKYFPREELRLYSDAGAFSSFEEYQNLLKMLDENNSKKSTEGDYIRYLRYLVPSICLDDAQSVQMAMIMIAQCDFLKYFLGIGGVVNLFEEKFESKYIDPWASLDTDLAKHLEEHLIDLTPYNLNKQELYHRTVFYLTDDAEGTYSPSKPMNLRYIDFTDIIGHTVVSGKYIERPNPARKSVLPNKFRQRKLMMEIYQILNGRMFDLYEGDKPGKEYSIKGEKDLVGRYPVIPWLSSGKEDTPHVMPFDDSRPLDDLFSKNVCLRQQRLGMEMRLTEIPVNCVEEFLIPDIYYTWDKQQELLQEVIEMNARLQRQMELNQELVRNLSHSSANYLNPDRLIQTGLELQNADGVNPGVDDLHIDGHTLLLQSEQETYMSRQLNSLVWRCSADIDSLAQQIRSGLTTADGVDVSDAVTFAMKSLLARIIFRDQDKRSAFIRKKLNKTEEEWKCIREDFIQDILATRQLEWETILSWWNRFIGRLSVSFSDIWGKIRVVREKSFYDLIIEITTELFLNALSHGDLESEIKMTFGEAEEFMGRSGWVYVLCENTVGDSYPSGRNVGLYTLNETMLLLNGSDRGIEKEINNGEFFTKVWLLARYLKALK